MICPEKKYEYFSIGAYEKRENISQNMKDGGLSSRPGSNKKGQYKKVGFLS